jgi:HEAT repeat protein
MKRTGLILLLLLGTITIKAQSKVDLQDDAIKSMSGSVEVATRRLSNFDPLIRQRAAEELAKLNASDQLKLIEGYYLQEKNPSVRLALEWALYRVGQEEKLFSIVNALDSSRYNQSYAYLSQLSDPTPLYLFFEKVNKNTLVRLIEVLGNIGNAETIDQIRPYTRSDNSKLKAAASFSIKEISRRLEGSSSNGQSRPRQVGDVSQSSQE